MKIPGFLFLFLLVFPLTSSAAERTVEVGVATLGGTWSSRQFPAVLSAVQSSTLSFVVGGQLIEIRTKTGDFVKKGDVLMRIDPRDFEHAVNSAQARLEAASAQLLLMKAGARLEDLEILKAKLRSARAQQAFAKREYERAQTLLKKKAITTSELEQMETNLLTAEAAIQAQEQELLKARAGERQEEIAIKEAEIASLKVNLAVAQAALDDTNLRAPFDGIVAVQNVNNYEIVHPGTPVVTIMDISRLNVTIWLPESNILQNHQRKIAGTVTFPMLPQREFPAKLKEGEAIANAQTRAWKVVFEMENPPDVEILPGMTAMLTIHPENENEIPDLNRVLIPVSALCADSRGQFVWVVGPKNQPIRRRVKPGILKNSQEIEILEGLEDGERIVTGGAQFLTEKDQIRTNNE